VAYNEFAPPEKTTLAKQARRLATCVPDLSLDRFVVTFDASRSEFHSYGGLGLKVELIPRETRQQVTLPDSRIANQHH